MWAETLLRSVEPNIHIVCGVTVPFRDVSTNYKEIKNKKEIWFKRYKTVDNNLNYVYKNTGEYLQLNDLFQIVDDKLISHNIINSSPIWEIKIHNKVGLFEENNWNAETDYIMWILALKNDFIIKFNKNYKVGFFISENQHHKNQKSHFNKIINKYSPDNIKKFFNKN